MLHAKLVIGPFCCKWATHIQQVIMLLTWLALFLQLVPLAHYCGANLDDGTEIKYCDANQRGSCSSAETVTRPKIADGCFRAAVYEHERKDLVRVNESARYNLGVFQDVAKIAAQSGANILVFPEDGIIYGTANYIRAGLTEIPDPELLNQDSNNPCLQPELFGSEILRNLSCIARENNLYVVANFGTKQHCEPKSQVLNQVCPDIGYLALNTDVVLDQKGAYIKRYRKFNMFIEVFDKAPSLELTYFDTPFGRFGLFTCFDIMFERPAIELVEKYNIDTALFPTFWYDELPFLTAIQFQDAWSWANNVNLLGANVHKRYLGSVGSGIFSGYNSIYVGPNDTDSRLLIATIPKKHSLKTVCEFDPLMVNVQVENPQIYYDYKQFRLLPSDAVHILKTNEGNHSLCTGEVCCSIDYKIHPKIPDDKLERLIVIARDSVRQGSFNWYEQICAVATLRSPIDLEQIDQSYFSMEGVSSFDRLFLQGTFSTRHIFPTVAYNVNELLPRKERDFNCAQLGTKQDNIVTCTLEYTGQQNNKTIYSFGMYGRKYNKDQMPEDW